MEFSRLENWVSACANNTQQLWFPALSAFPAMELALACTGQTSGADHCWTLTLSKARETGEASSSSPSVLGNLIRLKTTRQLCKGVKQHLGRLVLFAFIGWSAQIPLKSFQQSQNGCFFSQDINWKKLQFLQDIFKFIPVISLVSWEMRGQKEQILTPAELLLGPGGNGLA